MKTLARRRDHAELLQRLRSVNQESVRRWGRMSAHQMVCHVGDSFRVLLGEKVVAPTSGRLRGAVLKGIALYVPLRWPPGIVTSREIDQEHGGTPPIDFPADLAELEALLVRVGEQAAGFQGPRHPIFGRMSDGAWLRWGYLHTDHHLRQFGA